MAISGALAFNYFVADPVYQINYQRPYDFIPPVVFIVCAGLSAIISGRARDEASAAHAARTQLEELLDISRRFQGADTLESIRDVLIAELNRRGPDCLLYWQDDAGLQRIAGDHDTPDEAMHVMARVADPATPAPGLYIQPLHAGDGCIGALACRTARGAAQEPGGDAKVLIEGLARLANLALALDFIKVTREAKGSADAHGLLDGWMMPARSMSSIWVRTWCASAGGSRRGGK